eukprot:gene11983-5384_t
MSYNRFYQGSRIDLFQRQYRAFSGAFSNKPEIDNGGKIILPPSALDELSRLNVVYPMLFEIISDKNNKMTHSGVLEFSGDEGKVYLPFWIQQHLGIKPGEIITIKNATLPKGTFTKLRPQQKAFIELTDPKAVLEKLLRNFSTLTKGDTIIINYLSKNYLIDILQVGKVDPDDCNAISIVETDVRVEFEKPLDMVDEEEEIIEDIKPLTPSNLDKSPKPTEKKEEKNQDTFQTFSGSGRRVDGKQPKKKQKNGGSSPSPKPKETSNDDFIAFGGMGRTTSMKSMKQEEPKILEKTTSMSSMNTPSPQQDFSPFKGVGRTVSMKTIVPQEKKEEKKAPFIPFQQGGRSLKK